MQHDYGIDNNTGRNVRLDINDVLSAIVTNNSGDTEPTTTFPFMLWADTTTDILKLRNEANSAWIELGSLISANLGALLKSGGTMTGVLLVKNAGTVGTPDLAFASDSDTGFYTSGANLLGLVAGGVELLRADGVLGYVKLIGTKALQLPSGTTAQRPTGVDGLLRFNSDTSQFEAYFNSNWGQIGGGGGGAGFKWNPISGTAPVEAEENGELVKLFQATLSQELYASIKVPQSYSGGTQIKLYLSVYSPSSSNNILVSSQSTLIRKNTDAFTSTTNQRTSTNAALTNTLANMIREIELDLTDSTGKINSVSVSAGDVIKVRIYRGTDTDTADLRLIPNSTDVKYS